MKRILFCLLVMVAQAAFAQDSGSLNAGTNFVHSIAPTSNRQVINPGAVNANAWSGNTSAPTTVPTGLGGFSSPKNDVSVYNSARSGGLVSLGNKAQIDCQNFIPGNDPLRNQECAAVNFLSNKCITPSSGQASILGSLGSSQAANSAGCEGTYGQGAQQFNFKDQITEQDSIFDSMRNLKDNATATVGQICTEKTVIIEPAKFDINTCLKTSITDTVSCSQYLNMSVTTTKTAATITKSCNDGTLVGAFCQKSSSGAAAPVYACAAGYTLSGTTCSKTTSAGATPNYYCTAGSTLSGSNCISVNNVSTPALVASYSCPAGATLSGANCLTTTTVAATIANYSCPAGQTLSGASCVQTISTTNPGATTYSCPAGTTRSGSDCISTKTSSATPHFYCPTDQTIYGEICRKTTTSTATPQKTVCGSMPFYSTWTPPNLTEVLKNVCVLNFVTYPQPGLWFQVCAGSKPSNVSSYSIFALTNYSGNCAYFVPLTCPSGQTLSDSSCISTTTTTATISSYSCPSGGTVSGSNCVTTSTTTATVSYSCPVGQTLSGSNCTQTTTTTSAATPGYACSAGYTLSGTTCSKTTSAGATPNYSCPAGSTLSGSNCTSANNVTTAATVASYSCPAGATLSGSNCLTTATAPATVASYTCPAGATLSGTNCITVVTTPAIINYSCSDGSAPVAGICFFRSANTSWTNTCGPLENSAGVALGTPK